MAEQEPQLKPQFDALLSQKIAIPYTTTVPTYTPNVNGARVVYFDGTNYFLYVYANGGWRNIQFGTAGISGRSHKTANQTFTAGGAITKVVFETNDYAAGITWDATNNRFTVLTAAKYLVAASLYWNSNTQPFIFYTIIYKNGVEYSRSGFQSSVAAGILITLASDTLNLAVNDYIEIFMFSSDPTNNQTILSSGSSNFNIMKVG